MPSLIAQEMRRLAALTRVPFAVRFADGSRFDSPQGPPAFILIFHTVGAELATATFGHIGLLDAYFDGEIDIKGDLRAMFRLGFEAKFGDENPLVVARNRWQERAHSNASRDRAKDNARFHYGLGAPFYGLWLDEPRMMYTCAYWKDGTTTLGQAQANKIDHVCRKIRLAAGERFVDIGCGFGGFMFRAHDRTGATGVGLNTATEQVGWLRAEIAGRGLDGALAVREADFREVDGPYDTLFSAAAPVVVLLAALLVLLQPFIACDRAHRTVYAVTDRRLLQVRDGLLGRKLRAACFGSFSPPVLDLRADGTGTISFEPRPSAGGTGGGNPVLTRFSAVPGAARVHRLILDRMGPEQGGRSGAPDMRDYLELLIQGKRTIDDA